MKLFVLPNTLPSSFWLNSFPAKAFSLSVTIATLFLLTSCSSNQFSVKAPITPNKVFQYSYQEPTRQLSNSALTKKLSSGKVGDMVTTKSAGKFTTIHLGKRYYSANGNECRRYTVNPSNEKAACKINNRWYQAKPILVKE